MGQLMEKPDDSHYPFNNVLFYKGVIQSKPNGDYIDNIHRKWFGDYYLLEHHHGYIQWLFPTREEGMNSYAQPLLRNEGDLIQADTESYQRVLRSYQMMLDFYGMKLLDPRKGLVGRSNNWRERYANLVRSPHNYLRITRILKSLGELGYEHFKKPFLRFVLVESLINRTLVQTTRSCQDFWIKTLKTNADREELYRYINSLKQLG